MHPSPINGKCSSRQRGREIAAYAAPDLAENRIYPKLQPPAHAHRYLRRADRTRIGVRILRRREASEPFGLRRLALPI